MVNQKILVKYNQPNNNQGEKNYTNKMVTSHIVALK
jgi:hypothetical protein